MTSEQDSVNGGVLTDQGKKYLSWVMEKEAGHLSDEDIVKFELHGEPVVIPKRFANAREGPVSDFESGDYIICPDCRMAGKMQYNPKTVTNAKCGSCGGSLVSSEREKDLGIRVNCDE